MTSASGRSSTEKFLSRLGQKDGVSLEEKRRHLKVLRNAFKHGESSVLSPANMPAVLLLAEDVDWQVRQDVAELLLYAPEEHFSQLAARLMADPNGYVRRSAERSRERRQKAQLEARQASRGIEEVTKQYESLTRQVGGEMADKAISLGEARFELLADELLHDLLTMLTPLKAQVRGLTSGLAKVDRDLLQMAVKSSEDLDFLEQYIRAVVAYSKALPVERHPEWVQEVVRQAGEQVHRNLAERGVDLNPVALDDGEVAGTRVPMCRELIVQALANIVTNAYESLLNEEGRLDEGRIGITTRTADGHVAIEVRDNGCGMSPDELTALLAFLPGRKNAKKKRSMGLGLLTAKKNVEAHYGTLRVESELGKGTAVTITLPLAAQDAENG